MIIRDFLDNDLYKFTTMNAIQKKFPSAVVRYQFINRGATRFPPGFAQALQQEVDSMSALKLTCEGEAFVRERCYYFDPVFIDLMKGFRFDPSEISILQDDDDLKIEIEGLWYRTVLWEVPLMAIVSELYFRMTRQLPDEFEQRVMDKSKTFAGIKAEISEFGTRRRFSFDVQDRVIELLKQQIGGLMNGTSNVYLAMKHDLRPIGTHPHEWFMYHGAHFGYRSGTTMALDNWVDVYHGSLGIALTDTYTTPDFLHYFDVKFCKLFDGVRQDSGDPLQFTDLILAHYKANRVDATTKTIVYSDALDVDKVKQIKQYVAGRIHDVYGIGTYLSNDVGADPLNMVIKLVGVKPHGQESFIPAVKLSDSMGKHSGDADEIALCLKIVNR